MVAKVVHLCSQRFSPLRKTPTPLARSRLPRHFYDAEPIPPGGSSRRVYRAVYFVGVIFFPSYFYDPEPIPPGRSSRRVYRAVYFVVRVFLFHLDRGRGDPGGLG